MKIQGIEIYNALNQIPKLDYEGYVWMSDKSKPFDAKGFKFNDVEVNPFIQEALLFCKEKNISVMIRHTGEHQITEFDIRHTGKYQITEFDLGVLNKEGELESKEYFSHRIDGVKKLKFKQLWLPEVDKNCEGMEVLTLKAHIFMGFKND